MWGWRIRSREPCYVHVHPQKPSRLNVFVGVVLTWGLSTGSLYSNSWYVAIVSRFDFIP